MVRLVPQALQSVDLPFDAGVMRPWRWWVCVVDLGLSGMAAATLTPWRRAGIREAAAARLNCLLPSQLLDASASLVPWSSRWQRIGLSAWRDYPDRSQVGCFVSASVC